MRKFIATTFFLFTLTAAACAQDVPITPKPAAQPDKPKPAKIVVPKLPPDQNKFAVIISGIGGAHVRA